jgi:hypothetical protein
VLNGVSGQLHFVPSTHCMGGWTGCITGLDDWENRDIWIQDRQLQLRLDNTLLPNVLHVSAHVHGIMRQRLKNAH